MHRSNQIPIGTFRKLWVLLAVAGTSTFSQAQSTFDWLGDISGDWATPGNWAPAAGAPPGSNTSDIARFDDTSANSNLLLGGGTTISNLQFTSNSGSYTFSGSAMTVAGSGTFVSNSSGKQQVFENSLILQSDTSKTISNSTGSALTLNSLELAGQSTRRNLILTGGGETTINAFVGSGNNRINQLQVLEGSTLNWGATSTFTTQNFMANDSRINLYANTGNSGITLSLLGASGEIYIASNNLTVSAVNIRFNGNNGNNKLLTLGADISGGGNATFSGTVYLNDSNAGTNQTYRLYAAGNNTLNLSGTITDSNAAGEGSRVDVSGPGVVRFTGSNANTSTTPISIASGATLELAKTNNVIAIANGGHVTINDGGTLRLAASGQIGNEVGITFSGGTFNVSNFSENVGELTVDTLGGTIDFGDQAGTITFASLDEISGTLSIAGWGLGAAIYFLDGNGWDADSLALVHFIGYGSAQFNSLTGELYASPIPEPATTAVMLAVAIMAGTACLRRRQA